MITVLVTFLLSSSFATAQPSYCGASFSDPHPAWYEPADFPHSDMWLGKKTSDYPDWASRAAGEVAHKLSRGEPAFDIIQEVAAGRRALQLELGVTVDQGAIGKVGILRFSMGQMGKFMSRFKDRGRRLVSPIGMPEDMLPLKADPRFEYWNLLQEIHPRILIEGYQHIYTTLRGLEIPATLIGRHRLLSIAAQHPASRESRAIFLDVLARIDFLRSDGRAADESAFFEAMHGFFQSMPYYRGTAAIGRSFFAGLYLHLYGKKLLVPTDIDVYALIYPKALFIEKFCESRRAQPRVQ